ncbi:MAG: MBL fold metallo-hydrolase [Ilumatobacteraceae bacterium]
MLIGGERGVLVTFHGVRGSTPCHGEDVQRYGGNTSCVSLAVPGQRPILFDLGTGLRYFGLTQPIDGTFRGACLLTHLHWDHAQGLPFFKPILAAGAELDIYGPVQPDGRTLDEAVRNFLSPPHVPVGIDALPGTIRIHDVGNTEFRIGDAEITSRLVPHVGNTLDSVTWNGVSIAYISDHQMPLDGSFAAGANVRELVQDVDLLIHDAQYTPEEFAEARLGPLHSEFAVWLAREGNVRRLALYHHDPVRDDTSMDALRSPAPRTGLGGGIDVFAAAEGLAIHLDPS